MGQTLSEPVTNKESSTVASPLYQVGASCMQGWRITMEDAHTHILSLPDDPGTAFFAVYDGHGGARIAQYAGKHLHKFVCKTRDYKEGNIVEALRKGFMDIDAAMLEDESLKDELAGTTAICVLIKDNIFYCANVGDSRAIGCKNGAVHALSHDHKPNNDEELRRITAAGGWVEFNRVNGNLALSRALGDFVFKKNEKKDAKEQIVIGDLALSRALGDFVFKKNEKKDAKEQIVIALPDVISKKLSPDWEFIVIACDGIWDVMTNEEVSDFVRSRIGSGMEPEEICEDLMTRCLAPDCQMGGLGCDNMTVVIICFLHGNPYSSLVNKCSLLQ